jgi:fructokinase
MAEDIRRRDAMENSKKFDTNAATIVAYGEALWDLLPSGPVLGGAPLNFAYRINSLGYRGIMISQLGHDTFGDQALEQMTALGMETDFIQRTSDYPTGTVEIVLDENKNPDYTIIPKVAYDYIRYTDDLDTLIADADCLCFGSLIQRTAVSRETLQKLLKRFSGKYVLYDINLRKNCYTAEIVTSSMKQSHILKLNNDEMPVVAEMYGIPDTTVAEFAKALFQHTPLEYCLITLGGRGAFAASRTGEQVYEPAYKVQLIDTCGSGDAFTAGFLRILLANQDLREACKFGNALGAMVAERHGATQTIRYEEIERFLQKRETIEVESQFQEYC